MTYFEIVLIMFGLLVPVSTLIMVARRFGASIGKRIYDPLGLVEYARNNNETESLRERNNQLNQHNKDLADENARLKLELDKRDPFR